jgi:hypothetical protein
LTSNIEEFNGILVTEENEPLEGEKKIKTGEHFMAAQACQF